MSRNNESECVPALSRYSDWTTGWITEWAGFDRRLKEVSFPQPRDGMLAPIYVLHNGQRWLFLPGVVRRKRETEHSTSDKNWKHMAVEITQKMFKSIRTCYYCNHLPVSTKFSVKYMPKHSAVFTVQIHASGEWKGCDKISWHIRLIFSWGIFNFYMIQSAEEDIWAQEGWGHRGVEKTI